MEKIHLWNAYIHWTGLFKGGANCLTVKCMCITVKLSHSLVHNVFSDQLDIGKQQGTRYFYRTDELRGTNHGKRLETGQSMFSHICFYFGGLTITRGRQSLNFYTFCILSLFIIVQEFSVKNHLQSFWINFDMQLRSWPPQVSSWRAQQINCKCWKDIILKKC